MFINWFKHKRMAKEIKEILKKCVQKYKVGSSGLILNMKMI